MSLLNRKKLALLIVVAIALCYLVWSLSYLLVDDLLVLTLFAAIGSTIFGWVTWNIFDVKWLGTFSVIFVCIVVWGLIGFSIGFFGSLVLYPESNQGPLVGIFITGPAGLLVGTVIGVVLSVFKSSDLQIDAL